MSKIGVVILNYLAYKATIDCIECFLKQEQKNLDMHIVVVDNDSPNESYSVLHEKYKDNNRITVVRTPKNEGFARGNNFGYDILKKIMDPDFVVFSNDDILLNDCGVFSWILSSFELYNFAILGPRVHSIYGKYFQSPLENYSQSKKECKRKYVDYMLLSAKLRVKIILKMNSKSLSEKRYKDSDYSTMTDKKTLHGSFLIMSRLYLDEYETPFDPGTYLYMEENILRLRCDKKGLLMLYLPDYEVSHLQSVATNMISSNQSKKDYTRVRNIMQSLKYYISILDED